jgi:hypothetical protein
MTLAEDPQTEFVAFGNDTLSAKFECYREILMNGLSHHSELWLREVRIVPGSRIVDFGCGFREAGHLAEGRCVLMEAALRGTLAPYQQDGQIVMPSGSWRDSARKLA